MRTWRVSAAALLMAGTVLGVDGSVAAAPPSNDTIAGATIISALPFGDTLDTTEATTDPTEESVAQPCVDLGAPAVESTVWYTGTVGADDLTIAVDATASSYAVGIALFAGPPSVTTFVTCAPGRAVGTVSAGQTYYVMVFDAVPGSTGGTLEISVFEATLPTLTIAVDSLGHFDPRSGTATVGGTAMCSGTDIPVHINGMLRQSIGRFTVNGFFFAQIPCDGTAYGWTADIAAENGKYAGGKATVMVEAFACSVAGCDAAFVEQQLRLVR